MSKEKLIVYCDGGSRGNPGHSAVGVYILGLEKKYSKYIGERTNNEAEYEAVIFALKKIKQLLGTQKAKKTKLEFRLDSELVVRQINREYKILEQKLKILFVDVLNGTTDFKLVTFVHISREENSIADNLVNQELDAQQQELF